MGTRTPTAKLGGARADRFSQRSVAAWYWLDREDVTGATPTLLEITASTDLTEAIAAVSGFTDSANFTETPDLADHRSGKILDGISTDDGTITFYAARDGQDASAFFAMGDLGYLMHLPYGEGKPYNLYAVEVGSVSTTPEITGATQVNVAYGLNEKTPNVAWPTT